MHISINAGLLSSEAFGIRTYLENLLKAVVKLDRADKFSLITGEGSLFKGSGNVRIVRPLWPTGSSFHRNLWEQTVLPLMIAGIRPDVFHTPDHVLPLISVACRKIVTVHDLAFYRQPRAYSFRKKAFKTVMTPLSIKRSDRIIAVSENTKKDIIEYFGTCPEKIDVVHNGVGGEFKVVRDENGLKDARKRYGLERPFILFVGTIEPRKNIARLIEAFVLSVKEKFREHDLVIVGKKGWLFEDVFALIREKGEGRIKVLQNVPSGDLPYVYNLSELFVYPSLYEGFGIPPLEAMACGIPVITSNTSSLPEVAGEAAIKVNPCNTGNIADAMMQVLSDSGLRRHMIHSGLERVKLFTWEEAAKKTLSVYERTFNQ